MASSIGDLGKSTVQSANQNQFLGQTATVNPLLELAQGIMGNAATAQGRGDMAFGGGAGVPTLNTFSDPAGGQHTQIVRRGFQTPGTTSAGSGSGSGSGSGGGSTSGVPPKVAHPVVGGGTTVINPTHTAVSTAGSGSPPPVAASHASVPPANEPPASAPPVVLDPYGSGNNTIHPGPSGWWMY